jgi:hypothetical protein
MTRNIGGFIKIGAEKFVRDLYDNGTVYCNAIQFFRRSDERDGRGDPFEGVARLRNLNNISRIEIQVSDRSHPPIHLKTVGGLQIKELYQDFRCNLFCLYFIDSDKVIQVGSGRVNPDYKRLGSHFLIIHEPQRFLDLVTGALNLTGYKFRHGPVEFYDDKTFDGELTLFHKRRKFEYQSEFRFVIFNSKEEPIKIKIGPLKDIALLFESKVLDDIEFRPMFKKLI